MSLLFVLYLIEILHQTTTTRKRHSSVLCCILSKFYIKPQRSAKQSKRTYSCILSKFYIKPQPVEASDVERRCCILSKFYIKPQQRERPSRTAGVVSYRNSTSNHNGPSHLISSSLLYLIEILHQTTTQARLLPIPLCCILSKFYIKPQRESLAPRRSRRCILSKFYIKPQLSPLRGLHPGVVSYRNSTSNHNQGGSIAFNDRVVSYRNSTSNHNSALVQGQRLRRCILSKFYIKPQLCWQRSNFCCVVSYRNSTSNHNCSPHKSTAKPVVSYRNSTSNHNSGVGVNATMSLYLIEILHQTTTRVQLARFPLVLYLIEILHQTTTPRVFLCLVFPLYLIEILHQTTTQSTVSRNAAALYLIEILHQTTTSANSLVA